MKNIQKVYHRPYYMSDRIIHREGYATYAFLWAKLPEQFTLMDIQELMSDDLRGMKHIFNCSNYAKSMVHKGIASIVGKVVTGKQGRPRWIYGKLDNPTILDSELQQMAKDAKTYKRLLKQVLVKYSGPIKRK